MEFSSATSTSSVTGVGPDYLQAMALMLQADEPADYLIASGTTTSLRDFAQAAFAEADLDMADHLESVEALKRPADQAYSAMNPSPFGAELGWHSNRPGGRLLRRCLHQSCFNSCTSIF